MATDPGEAHREEIFEGLIDAMRRGDVGTFAFFNEEWERIDTPRDGDTIVRFVGEPRLHTSFGTCPHCGVSWATDGISLGGGAQHDLIQQQLHMFYRCPKRKSCRCWVDAVDGKESWTRCMKCDEAEPLCRCNNGITEGPCLLVKVVTTWRDEEEPMS